MYVDAMLAVQPKICCRCMCLINDRQHTLPEPKAVQATCLIFSRVMKANGKRKRLAEKLAVISQCCMAVQHQGWAVTQSCRLSHDVTSPTWSVRQLHSQRHKKTAQSIMQRTAAQDGRRGLQA